MMTTPGSPRTDPPAAHRNDRAGARRLLGLHPLTIIGLALLGAPRVVLHDLGIIHEGTVVNGLFVVIPPAIWIAVVLVARVPRPFVALFSVGVVYGIVLLAVHQLLWGQAFPDGIPRLGGNLGSLDPTVQDLIVRSFSGLSSLVTGTLVGAVTGVIATGLSALLRRVR